MRANLAMFLLATGTLVGCASNPPPPPPMAMAPEPTMAPAPAPMMSAMSGIYRGTSEAAAENRRGCARGGAVTARVAANNTFSVLGLRGRINPDGTVSSAARRGGGLSGTVQNGTMDVNVTKGRCSYHVTASHA